VHVLIVTCAHRGDDARIVHRQARSLLAAGHRVTLVAPPSPDAADDPPGLVRRPVPRAAGRRRLRAWRAVRAAVRHLDGTYDLLLLHDPELVPLLARRRRAPVVWDVHEDFVASVADRRWIPRWVRPGVARAVRLLECSAQRRCHLILAEDAYAERLGDAPVVPNSTWVPAEPAPLDPHVPPRVVYVGRLSAGRGAAELVEVGRRLHGRAEVVLIGDADADVRAELEVAEAAGWVTWHRYLANPEAMRSVDGAVAGLALLHDEANYRHSRPTKVVEYLAHGVPVVTTPLPLAAEVVEASGGGVVVPFGDVASVADAVVAAVDRWLADPAERDRAGRAGHAYVREHFGWQADGARFVELLERWAGGQPAAGLAR
jgi:glycosyltransferase involved in cell wall biosynthesis